MLLGGWHDARRSSGGRDSSFRPPTFQVGQELIHGFRLAGKTWDGAVNAVLHTMHHPDRPGRYITVFLANGDAGWSRLRLIRFYARDTSIVWEGEKVIDRRAFEPDRRIRAASRD